MAVPLTVSANPSDKRSFALQGQCNRVIVTKYTARKTCARAWKTSTRLPTRNLAANNKSGGQILAWHETMNYRRKTPKAKTRAIIQLGILKKIKKKPAAKYEGKNNHRRSTLWGRGAWTGRSTQTHACMDHQHGPQTRPKQRRGASIPFVTFNKHVFNTTNDTILLILLLSTLCKYD